MQVFDRSGQRVYKGGEGWNGRLNNTGAACPVGVYTYHIRATPANGHGIEKTGTVTLLR